MVIQSLAIDGPRYHHFCVFDPPIATGIKQHLAGLYSRCIFLVLFVADDLKVRDGNNLYLWSVDRANGNVLWKRPLGPGNHKEMKQNMSTPSPVTDGEHVWVFFSTGILACLDIDGNEIWKLDVGERFGKLDIQDNVALARLCGQYGLIDPVRVV